MRLKWVFCLFTLMMMAGQAWSLEVYSLQGGAFKTLAEAETFKTTLSERFAPIFIERETDGTEYPWKVLVGHFPYQAEAWVFKSLLRDLELPGCFIKTWTWDGRELEDNHAPVQLPFDRGVVGDIPRETSCRLDCDGRGEIPAEAVEAVEADSLEGLTDGQLYHRGDWGDIEMAIPSLEKLVDSYPSSDFAYQARIRLAQHYSTVGRIDEARSLLDYVSFAGSLEEHSRAELCLAYLVCRSGTKPEAYEAFRDVVHKPGILPEQRVEGMVRASLAAYGLQDYPTAWLAFTQLEQVSSDAKIRAVAGVHKAAIAFELVSRQNSSWQEVQTLCEQAESFAEAPGAIRSTAALMYGESFYECREYERAIAVMERIVELYPEVNRERTAALFWKGRCLNALGRYQEAIQTLGLLEQEPIEESEMFAGFHIKARALLDKARSLMREGQVQQAQEALAALMTEYPNAREAQSLSWE